MIWMRQSDSALLRCLGSTTYCGAFCGGMPRPPDLDSMKPDDVKALAVDLLEENGRLRDEIARLKGLPPRPPFKPSRMEDGTDSERTPSDKRSARGFSYDATGPEAACGPRTSPSMRRRCSSLGRCRRSPVQGAQTLRRAGFAAGGARYALSS